MFLSISFFLFLSFFLNCPWKPTYSCILFLAVRFIQDIEYSSPCYRVGPCSFFPYMKSLHLLIPNSQSIPPPPTCPSATTSLVSASYFIVSDSISMNVSTFFWPLFFHASLCQQGALYSCPQEFPPSLETLCCLLRGLSLPILKLPNVVTNHVTLVSRAQRPWRLVC